MLPDFPETKRLFSRFFRTYARIKFREVSPYRAVQMRYLHEGRAMKVTRADKTESTSGLEQLTGYLEIKPEEIKNLTFLSAIDLHNKIIDDMVQKQTQFIRDRLSREIPESQTVDAQGRKFSAQIIIEALEKLQIDFNPDGTPQLPFIDAPLITPERIAAVHEEFESNPELRKKFNEMIDKKREEWRAREADRKLVG